MTGLKFTVISFVMRLKASRNAKIKFMVVDA